MRHHHFTMHLLSASGSFRTILILVILWMVLRMWMRSQDGQMGQGGGPSRPPSPPDVRPKGEVRIERREPAKPPVHRPDVEDADFEEIN